MCASGDVARATNLQATQQPIGIGREGHDIEMLTGGGGLRDPCTLYRVVGGLSGSLSIGISDTFLAICKKNACRSRGSVKTAKLEHPVAHIALLLGFGGHGARGSHSAR